ncbi:MAG: hypothetical protein D6739_07565, partial [Nitrospirae bacterium]
LGGEIAVHREAVLPILGPEGAVRRIFLCSAGPAAEGGALVVLQDITDLHRLPGLIPICAQCHQVRHDGRWLTLESFVEARSHALFTHTLCPACTREFYERL